MGDRRRIEVYQWPDGARMFRSVTDEESSGEIRFDLEEPGREEVVVFRSMSPSDLMRGRVYVRLVAPGQELTQGKGWHEALTRDGRKTQGRERVRLSMRLYPFLKAYIADPDRGYRFNRFFCYPILLPEEVFIRASSARVREAESAMRKELSRYYSVNLSRGENDSAKREYLSHGLSILMYVFGIPGFPSNLAEVKTLSDREEPLEIINELRFWPRGEGVPPWQIFPAMRPHMVDLWEDTDQNATSPSLINLLEDLPYLFRESDRPAVEATWGRPLLDVEIYRLLGEATPVAWPDEEFIAWFDALEAP